MFFVVRKDTIDGDGNQRVYEARDKAEDAWVTVDKLSSRLKGEFTVFEGQEVTRPQK